MKLSPFEDGDVCVRYNLDGQPASIRLNAKSRDANNRFIIRKIETGQHLFSRPLLSFRFLSHLQIMTDLSEWKPEYSVGNRTLDLQHKKLLALCKRVSSYKCNRSKASIDEFHGILNDLAFYASKHFETEEQVLRQIGYPMLSSQKEQHDGYSETLVEFLLSAINGNIDNTALHDYLEKWWINHILISDMEYSAFLKENT